MSNKTEVRPRVLHNAQITKQHQASHNHSLNSSITHHTQTVFYAASDYVICLHSENKVTITTSIQLVHSITLKKSSLIGL